MYRDMMSGDSSFLELNEELRALAAGFAQDGKSKPADYLLKLVRQIPQFVSGGIAGKHTEIIAQVKQDAKLIRGKAGFIELARALASLIPRFAHLRKVAHYLCYLVSDLTETALSDAPPEKEQEVGFLRIYGGPQDGHRRTVRRDRAYSRQLEGALFAVDILENVMRPFDLDLHFIPFAERSEPDVCITYPSLRAIQCGS
jgi:hypothetical protein